MEFGANEKITSLSFISEIFTSSSKYFKNNKFFKIIKEKTFKSRR